LNYNQTLTAEALGILEGRKLSFVYQRYGLNNYSGVELSEKFRVPLVLEYNGSEIWVGRHWDKPLKYEKFSEAIELLCLQKSAVVTVVSRPLKDELVGRGVPAEKILVNPNGVDPDQYSPQVDREAIRRKYALKDKTVIGFIGTFGRWHGAENLVEAYGQLLGERPEFRETTRLLMIGDGVRMSEVKLAIQGRDLADFCVLTGLVPQKEGPSYLSACDILASPTLPNPDGTPFFGSPTKLFEYMAMGKGIVASNLDQIGEVLKHDETAWLVKPGDTPALAEGLKILIEDPSRRKRLGEAARKEVAAKYTWKEHTHKIIEKLKERCS
jgi:glycosyltransferase involved in cell wall biosynthesis